MRRPSKWLALPTGVVTVAAMALSPVAMSADVLPPTLATIVDGDVTEYEWMLTAVNAQVAWSTSTGEGAVVAVIDTGVDVTHPDLRGRVVPGAMVVKDDSGVPQLVSATVRQTSGDRIGHGSHVSGIIAGNANGVGMTGVAPGASIMPIALETVRLRTVPFLTMVRDGVEYASVHGADVVNLSLGLPTLNWDDSSDRYDRALKQVCLAVDAATAGGTVVVVSAGNSGDWGNPQFIPAACASAVTVAALTPSLQKTYWSSFDGAVDLSAPGQDVLSVDSALADQEPTPHILMSGTSMAAPVVSGVAALLSAEHPSWSAAQIGNRMRATAQDISVPGRDPTTGFGLVDAAAALGVPAPLAVASDFFTTWVYPDPDNRRQAWVSWTTPQAHAVSGYTVTVHRQDGTSQGYDVDGLAVRAQVRLGRAEGWTVTAHTSAGDVRTYPALYRFDRSGSGVKPERLTSIRFERDGRVVTMTYDRPEHPGTIDKIKAHVDLGGLPYRTGHFHRTVRIDHDDPFPRSIEFRLPGSSKWYDFGVDLEVTNTDAHGRVIGGSWYSVKRHSAAFHGSRVEQVLGAGGRMAEVTGGVSAMRAQRVCGDRSCEGASATLVVRRGDRVQRISVRYNTDGQFHALVRAAAGAGALTLKVTGPRTLDSGAFQRFAIRG